MTLNKNIKNKFSPVERVTYETGVGQAQQQFKPLCDLNKIMAKFNATGQAGHFAKRQGEYAVVPSITLQEAMNVTIQAQQAFNQLPSAIRKIAQNDPVKLMQWLEDPENREQAEQLGLLNKTETPEEDARTAETPVEQEAEVVP